MAGARDLGAERFSALISFLASAGQRGRRRVDGGGWLSFRHGEALLSDGVKQASRVSAPVDDERKRLIKSLS
jgi:hypothetical protein